MKGARRRLELAKKRRTDAALRLCTATKERERAEKEARAWVIRNSAAATRKALDDVEERKNALDALEEMITRLWKSVQSELPGATPDTLSHDSAVPFAMMAHRLMEEQERRRLSGQAGARRHPATDQQGKSHETRTLSAEFIRGQIL